MQYLRHRRFVISASELRNAREDGVYDSLFGVKHLQFSIFSYF